jgi:glycine cleavage system aminomethyltransferase T/glycine/D-amino acid oxidase-like deaminating enzyme
MPASGDSSRTSPVAELPARARVVVVGGGIVGTSVAYHLTRLGWSDVVLLEQGRLSGGTTWHAAGLVGQLRATESGTRLVQYSASLYESLEAEVGLSTGFKRVGGVTVARTPDRMTQLRRTAASADAYGLECHLLTPAEALDRWPLIDADDLAGALWLPGDGTANPTDVTQALARGARLGGAQVFEQTRVLDVLVQGGVVTGVRTTGPDGQTGDVEAEVVVNCAGQWAAQVGAMAGVTVPLHSAEHFYVVTDQIEGVHPGLPILRDPDGYTYFKEEVGGLVVGGFEPEAKPWLSPQDIPHPFEFQLLDEDWEHFSVLMDSAVHRVPVLATTGIRKFYNGPESFTPDNQFILGAAPEVRNFYVGAGFNSVGIASAGGAGRALAEWIVEGEPSSDLTAVDIRRFARFHGNSTWLRDRVAEVLGLHYEIPWPDREMRTARPFRRSPVHHVVEAAGARSGSKMGWERPNFFAPPDFEQVHTWDKPGWLEYAAAEHVNTRTAVTVFDQTSFSKYLVTGPDAEAALQWLCTADVAVEPGRVVYTGMLNRRGTYESDVTVTRLTETDYLVVSSAATTERDQDHVRRHLPPDSRTSIVDVTSSYAVLGVMGPSSRTLLSRLSRADLDDFPFATSREIDLGHATVRATRMTYVGELGWELYVPAEFAVGVLEDLMAAGADLGVAPGGYYAIDSLRLEKGYRAFGRELTPDYGPVEAGLLFACKLRTDVDFLGRAALEATKAEGVRRRLVSFAVADPEVMLWGGELVLRDGVAAGQVMSAAWGATVGAAVGLAYVWDPEGGMVARDWLLDASYEVNAGGTRHPISVSLRPLVDPDGLATKA